MKRIVVRSVPSKTNPETTVQIETSGDAEGMKERRTKPNKKRRIILRERERVKMVKQEEKKRMESEKEEKEREKRTRRNREKKVKRKLKEKAKKAGVGGGDGEVSGEVVVEGGRNGGEGD